LPRARHDTHARLRAGTTSLRNAASFFVLGDAAAQRLHEIDHPVRRGKPRLALLHGAGLFGLQVREQRLLVAVAEGQAVEIGGLAVDNMPSERQQVRRDGEVR
jgi:hypothetical protein